MNFGRFEVEPGPSDLGFERYHVDFPNRYGASIIRGQYSYGGPEGLWELGVLLDQRLCRDSPLNEDVFGHLTEAQVEELLTEIEAFPALKEVQNEA